MKWARGNRGALFFLAAFPETPRTGGEMYCRILIDGLVAQGVDVRIIALDQEMHGVSIHDPSNSQAIRNTIRALLRNHEADGRVIVVDSWLYRYFWRITWRERLRGRSCLISFSQLCYWDTYQSLFSRTIQRIKALAALAPAHYKIGVSESVLQADLGMFRQSATSEVIPPGCDYLCQSVSQADCARMPAQIISVGNYTARKGYHVLIEALSLVGKLHPDLRGQITLRLAGNKAYNPDYVAKLRKQIADAGLEGQVILGDWIEREKLSQAFASSQLFAFASESEGYGMVVTEAMLHGLPVLLGDFMTARELIGPGTECGYVVPRRYPHAFARAIIDYFTCGDRTRMGDNARARARCTSISWNDVLLKFKRVIEAHY